MSNKHEFTRVGVGPFLLNSRFEILLGKRKGSHGAGEWSLPGGHIEKFETIEQATLREIKEETGLTKVRFLKKLSYSENFFPEEDKHYITCYTLAQLIEGEPQLIEPDKCEGWQWFDPMPFDHLPSPLFGGIKTQISDIQREILHLMGKV